MDAASQSEHEIRSDHRGGATDATLSETHLSIVVCVGDLAYKLKKPVRYEFVDQSTRELRERPVPSGGRAESSPGT